MKNIIVALLLLGAALGGTAFAANQCCGTGHGCCGPQAACCK
jgi:hypothetical protein